MEPVDESAPRVGVEEEQVLEDVALVVEGEKLLTSRCLLAYASPVFKSMFTSQFKERNQSEIELPGKRSPDVAELLRFLNPGTADVLEDGIESAIRMLPLAEEYQIKKLTDKCEETLLAEIEANKPQDFIIRCIQIADRYDLNNLLSYCIEKCSLSRSLWTLVKESQDISVEVKALVYEGRLQKLEEDRENYLCLKQRMSVVKNRLRDTVAPHENHCRCRTELKLRSPMQRTCNFCARLWCSDHVSSDSYRSSYWFHCNHRIGYNVANDNVLRNFMESKDM